MNFKPVDEASLTAYGESVCDHLFLFAPELKRWSSGKLDKQSVMNFVASGGNLILTASSGTRQPVRELASELGFTLEPTDYAVLDHVAYDTKLDDGKHVVIAVDQSVKYPAVVSTEAKNILFRGIGHSLNDENPLVFTVLNGSPSSVSWNPTNKNTPSQKQKMVNLAGSDIGLVSASQTRNNSRILFSGSLELFSDKYVDASVSKFKEGKAQNAGKSGNGAFVNELIQWVLQEKSVLRTKSYTHHRKGETKPREWYRIKDAFEASIELEEHQPNGKWVPFKLPKGDQIQFQSIMLDPYVRVNMVAGPGAGQFTTPSDLILPDVYGVFTFKVEYKRRGLTYITEKAVIPVRPFRHNEYPRFLSQAFPYYANMFSMMGGFLFVSVVFLFMQDWGVRGSQPAAATLNKKTN